MRHIALGIVGVMCIASIASAADSSWTGSYIGGDVGAVRMKSDGRFDPLPNVPFFGIFPNAGDMNDTGFVAGLHAGYNWQLSPSWLGGVEADWSWTDAKGSFTQSWVSIIGPAVRPTALTSMSISPNWLASVRGRVGNLVAPNALLYFTGGFAFADIDYSASANNETSTYASSASFSRTRPGYVLGGGLEWALGGRWSLRGEYLFYHLDTGSRAVAFDRTGNFAPPLGSSFSWGNTDLHTIRFGASYKF
jgi:outer membrane immunogenic protein